MTPDLQAALETVREALDEWYIPDSQYHAALALIEQRLGELETALREIGVEPTPDQMTCRKIARAVLDGKEEE